MILRNQPYKVILQCLNAVLVFGQKIWLTVSLAFLRQVEAYRGIAFLTSNMDQSIDDAVRSRLTSTLEYPHPSPAQARKAWTSLLGGRSNAQGDANEAAEHLSQTWDLDYRQINAALLLANAFANARKTWITTALIDEALEFKGESRRRAADSGPDDSKGRNGDDKNGIATDLPTRTATTNGWQNDASDSKHTIMKHAETQGQDENGS